MSSLKKMFQSRKTRFRFFHLPEDPEILHQPVYSSTVIGSLQEWENLNRSGTRLAHQFTSLAGPRKHLSPVYTGPMVRLASVGSEQTDADG
jgi:hypothetical protein